MKAIQGDTEFLVVKPAKSGWVIEGGGQRLRGEMLAGISDDEGLVEWFQEQLGFGGHKNSGPVPPTQGPVAEAAGANAPAADVSSVVKHMVDRFLSWKLPETFSPDGGISFERYGNKGTPHQYDRRQTVCGTNLFDANQAEEMVRHMLAGAPATVEALTQGERNYQAYRASLDTSEMDGSRESLKRAHEQFEQWIPDALPANVDGQIHFGRALAESLSDAVKAFLAAPVPDVTQALEPLAKLARGHRHSDDEDFVASGYDTVSGDIVTVTVSDLRALLRAGGLLTDDMLPPKTVAAGSAGGDKPPAGDVPFNDEEIPF